MKPTAIKVIFFDLDNTLFDHTRAERAAILALVEANPKIFHSVAPETFLKIYHEVNKTLWKKMANGEITAAALKRLRFEISLQEFETNPRHAEALSVQFFDLYSRQNCALPNVHKILDYLKPKYELGILSNGFPEIQETKLRNLGVAAYFKFKVYSGEVGAMKPSPAIFHAAQQRCGASANEIVFIGDSFEDDIKGAKAAGWRAIHFNPAGETNGAAVDLEIGDLLDLQNFF
jgi:putative hydrolase of the HAD superfamily